MDEFLQPDIVQLTVEQLGELSDEQFEGLLSAVNTAGFERSIRSCNYLARQMDSGLSARAVFDLLETLEILYDGARELEGTSGGSIDEMLEFEGVAGELGRESFETGSMRLRELVVVNPVVEGFNKIQLLQTGVLDKFSGVSSFVDLRPSFDEDRSRVEEFIPIILFRVLTVTDALTHHSFVFQMTREDLNVMYAAVLNAQKELSVLESAPRAKELLPAAGSAEQTERDQ